MNRHLHPSQGGGALIEALIAMLIVAFGVLGFVGMQARTAVANLEGYQRAQALVLLNDMAQRMTLNRGHAADYAAAGLIEPTSGAYDPPCPTAVGRDRDLCEWANLLRGAAEKDGTSNVGAITGARACIDALPTADTYLLSVVWMGVQASGGSPVACGKGSTAFPSAKENLRRGVSMVVRIGKLS